MSAGTPSWMRPEGANADAVAREVAGWLGRGERHRRVCALGRRGFLLSRMDARRQGIVDGLDLAYPEDRGTAVLMRVQGRPGLAPVDTLAALRGVVSARGEAVSVFHFGDRPGEGAAALAALAQIPGVRPAGVRPVLDELWGPENHQALFQINAARPDLLLVALPSPLREEWIHAHAAVLKVAVVWGVGRGSALR